MEDKLLEIFMEPERWRIALEKGAGEKGMNKASMRLLETPEFRIRIYEQIKGGTYKIVPPHQQLIPKDNGDFRTVYINEDVDRIILSIVNDMLFELLPYSVHKRCKSYQKGIGCGKVVQEVSKKIVGTKPRNGFVGWKSDLSKYFDSVPIEWIDYMFDYIEHELGKSKLIDVVRDYYHCDICFDPDGNVIEHYQSLKQGCAVASWLADALLYEMDDVLSQLDGYYVRYSDDCLFVGNDYEKAMEIMKSELGKKGLTLNPKKVEYLTKKKWFKFLGFSIRGSEISISKGRLKTFQKEIESRTVHSKNSPVKALNSVQSFLYKGNGQFSWATSVLPIVTVDRDVQEMNKFVMDCLKAMTTKKKKVGGLGYDAYGKEGVVIRGKGKNVTSNRNKTPDKIEGYYSLQTMRKALLTDRDAYDVLCMQM